MYKKLKENKILQSENVESNVVNFNLLLLKSSNNTN